MTSEDKWITFSYQTEDISDLKRTVCVDVQSNYMIYDVTPDNILLINGCAVLMYLQQFIYNEKTRRKLLYIL